MSRYFSKLAKRTGIAPHRDVRLRSHSTHADIRPTFQANKTEQATRSLEVNVVKVAKPPVPKTNAVAESKANIDSKGSLQGTPKKEGLKLESNESVGASKFTGKDNVPPPLIKAGSDNKNVGFGFPEVRERGSVMPVYGDAHHARLVKEEQQFKNSPQEDNGPSKTLNQVIAGENGEPDKVLLIAKRQENASSDNQALRQKNFNKRELNSGGEISVSGNDSGPEEKSFSDERKKRQLEAASDAVFAHPMQHATNGETLRTQPSSLEAIEKAGSHRSTPIVHLVSEREQTPEVKLEKTEPPAHDNSVDIHIGMISFEVHQAPENKTVPDIPMPAPRTVVIQQPQSSQVPRLSRYYLRGV